MTRAPRTVVAAGSLVVLTGVLLLGWFATGWADVRAQQQAARDAPHVAADRRGRELAHELRGELAALIAREVERPYFHYQNVFHDPMASAGQSVTPSPLVASRDPLVVGYFQIDALGAATTPTINDELPQLSEPRRLAENRRFRDEVVRSFASALAPPGSSALSAAARPELPDQAAMAPVRGVTIRVSPLAWRTLPFGGQPGMVAVRQVDTPDGRLVQGFVVDRTALTEWLASHAGDAVAELQTGDDGSTEIVPGWHLEVVANPRAVTLAAGEARAIARRFVARFVAVGVVALAAALLVVRLVARAERTTPRDGAGRPPTGRSC